MTKRIKIPLLDVFRAGFLYEMRDIEEEAMLYLNTLNIDNMEGDWLDEIGALVGEPRFNKSDEKYKLFIKARIIANSSYGRLNELHDALDLVLGSESTENYIQEYADVPKTLKIFVDLEFTPENIEKCQYLRQFFQAAVDKGVAILSVEPSADVGDRFGFSDLTGEIPTPTSHETFGDFNDENVGGNFSYILG